MQFPYVSKMVYRLHASCSTEYGFGYHCIARMSRDTHESQSGSQHRISRPHVTCLSVATEPERQEYAYARSLQESNKPV